MYDTFEEILFSNQSNLNINDFIKKYQEETYHNINILNKMREYIKRPEWKREELYFEIVMMIHEIYYHYRKEILSSCRLYLQKKLKNLEKKIIKINKKYENIPINLFGIHLLKIINEYLEKKIEVNEFMKNIVKNIEFEKRWTDYQIHSPSFISIKSTILSNSFDLSDIFDR
jgi:hypothetical protein